MNEQYTVAKTFIKIFDSAIFERSLDDRKSDWRIVGKMENPKIESCSEQNFIDFPIFSSLFSPLEVNVSNQSIHISREVGTLIYPMSS